MIRVVNYDPSWPRRFAALKDEYSAALARAGVAVVAIEHVGSTSVPGLAAKPIIDCDMVVTAEQVTSASDVLRRASPNHERRVIDAAQAPTPDDAPR